MRTAREQLAGKLREAVGSVLPIALIVLLLSFTAAPLTSGELLSFLAGAACLTLGMGLFTLGAEKSMTPIGEYAGAYVTRQRKLPLLIGLMFLLGVLITVAEPDLQVLAAQVPSIPNPVLIGMVAAGVGLFLVMALLRILFRVRLNALLIGFYALVFVLAAFAPGAFLAVAFDSGGVTTGPMTVPFILALGVGVASVRTDERARQDGFGLVALCSIGPILAVLLLGMVYRADEGASYASVMALGDVTDSRALRALFTQGIPHYAAEVARAMGPIAAFFVLLQLFALKLPGRELLRICVGLLYTFAGLTLFLTGANVGFLPVGQAIGRQLAALDNNWVLMPVGALIGYFIVAAEPAVHVLKRQVADMTDGAIPPRSLSISLSLGVAASLALAMARVLTGISILWILIPGYALALLLSFFVPDLFTAIAFDSGGVASGPMTATFLLPLATGACEQLGGSVMRDAFGIVALVAMTPLIAIQLLGLYYKRRSEREPAGEAPLLMLEGEVETTLDGGTIDA